LIVITLRKTNAFAVNNIDCGYNFYFFHQHKSRFKSRIIKSY
jgi:hypothetical protein